MAGPFGTILVPTDGSDDAILALQIAVDLAKRTGAALHLAHAWQIATYVGDPYSYTGALPNDFFAICEEAGRATLARESERASALGATVAQTHLLQGRPADVIVEAAREVGADLIVVGSRGHGPLRRLALGSVSDGIAHHAPCPVLVARGTANVWPPRRVIVGDDGSPIADSATTLAAAIARLYGATGMLVRGYAPLLTLELLDPTVARRQDELIESAERALAARAASLADAFGARPEPRLALGDPAAILVGAAEYSDEPTLIAVGSRGLGLVQRIRLGSTSTKVLHAAHCPVLIVPDEGVG